MGRAKIFIAVLLLALAGRTAAADDLTGSGRFLCAAVQATACVEDGECGIDVPWNLNIPDFFEVDLEAKRLSTTKASGENRATSIEGLIRQGGIISFHGFENGRAFSWVISEQTGRATVAVATDGASVAVFGACTPIVEAAGSAGR
ncbi:MAG TPA: hypothetical protein PKJ99_05005 [Thermoanaerobaculales bacterium]|nr:hypothetical protein [Thermoanaerobaculales bacterium]HPA80191.1 hypothetical protein [Thermoanaerobaculales bacterium]HQL30338.1 hypothetical protein [Thermoanaerobaculales bacterium]HQN95244.1 hypothetical protein [Thermoanaerobaculales bacterium]HQP43497.1 hypothetical protein [Thermoanaerobaculales bacterium]